MESGAPKRILVIDGGGMRGLACLLIIDEIMKAVGARRRKRVLPCEVFDIICGTSVGGFSSILLGRLGLDCETAIKHYEEAVKKLVGGETVNIWENIAHSQFLDTARFDAYLGKIVGEITGSPDVSMKAAIEDGQDPRKHQMTKTFVTLMEEAPDYPSLTHIIRSYVPKQQRQAPSINRHWTIPQVIAATIASPIYISPLSVKNDGPKNYSFQDPGFGGYNNPIEIALKEYQSNWPHGRIETVVSLGTGLQGFLPQPPPTSREWGPTPPYVKKMCSALYETKLKVAHRNEDIDLNVTYAIRELARIAADSNVAHHQVKTKLAARCDNYYRIDEAFGLNHFDLIDIGQASLVRSKVQEWAKGTGEQIITQIASKLVPESEMRKEVVDTKPPPPPPTNVPETQYFETKEDAVAAKPPPPPPGTKQGYNPLFDEPRPTNMQDYLKGYNVLFIVDDSDSMNGERWTEARRALADIANYALHFQVQSVSLRFLNNGTAVSGLQGAEKLKSIFDEVLPYNGTPTGFALAKAFDEHLRRISSAISKEEYSKVPPLDIIVLTDGVPSDRPADVIAEAVRRIKEARYHPNTMGVQFVQIGDEEKAKLALKELVKGNNGSIVDTVPYRGAVTSEKLQRILLGGIHPNVRSQIPLEWLATG